MNVKQIFLESHCAAHEGSAVISKITWRAGGELEDWRGEDFINGVMHTLDLGGDSN